MDYNIKHNMAYSIIGAFLQRGSSLIVSIYIARFLNPNILATYAVLLSNMYMFGSFLNFGITPATSRYISKKENNNKSESNLTIISTFIISLGIGTLASIILFFSAEIISIKIYNDIEYSHYLKITSLSLVFMAITAFSSGILYGYEQFNVVAKFNTINGAVSAILISFYTSNYGKDGVAISILISQIVTTLLSLYLIKNYIKLTSFKINIIKLYKKIIFIGKFGFYSFSSGALQGLANWLCIIILIQQANNTNDIVVFHISNQWYSLILFIPNISSNVLLPYFSKRGYSQFKKIFSAYAITGLICLLTLSVLSPIIIYCYGDVLKGYNLILLTTFLTGFIAGIKSPIEQAILADEKADIVLYINCIFVSIFIIGSYTFQEYGLLSIVVSRLIGYIIFFITIYLYYANHNSRRV